MSLVGDIAQTYIQGGQQQAEAQRQTGQLYGSAIAKIGELAAGIPQQLAEQKRLDLQAQEQQMRVDAITRSQVAQQQANQVIAGLPKNDDGTYDTGALMQRFAQSNVPLEDQERFTSTLDKLNGVITSANKAKINHYADVANVLLQSHKEGEPVTPEALHLGFGVMKASGLANEDDEQRFVQMVASGADPEQILKTVRGLGDKYNAPPKFAPLPANAAGIVNEATGQITPTNVPARLTNEAEMRQAAARVGTPREQPGDIDAKTAIDAIDAKKNEPTPKSLQTKSVLLDGKPAEVVFDPGTGNWLGPQGDPIAATRIRPLPPAATGNAEQEQSNAKTVASGIIAGDTAPSILEGTRGTAQGMALMAEIKRQGGNSDQILRNWLGTKNAIRSLNSAQQIRLAETINKASASLDRVEQLNNEWAQAAPRFGIKILNHANLKAAQNGAYGPEAASIAQRLEGQIADVTGEIGQAIMGGNSPTDHGLELAGKNISGDWSQQVLADSIKQVRYNLNLAQQARNELLGQVGSTSTQVQTPSQSKDPLGIR